MITNEQSMTRMSQIGCGLVLGLALALGVDVHGVAKQVSTHA
jgi:hypothetical protein